MVFLFEIMHAVGKVCSNWVGLKGVRSLVCCKLGLGDALKGSAPDSCLLSLPK